MQTSQLGIAFIDRFEGVVLKAYRCPAGIWTIGAGLTAASGVVKPRAGMVISEAEALRLLDLALHRNYEPAVRAVMPGAEQHEFDAAVSFQFNTGAIARASWVKRWKVRDWPGVHVSLGKWNKGGGKVLPGLTRRRAAEYALLVRGDYGISAPTRPQMPAANEHARIAAPVTAADLPRIQRQLHELGFNPGGFTNAQVTEISSVSVRQFQRAHGLTADGIIGRATSDTLRRVFDARAKAKLPAAATAPVAAEVAVPDGLLGVPWVGEIALAALALRLGWLGWHYRDTIAPVFDKSMPRLAAFLRSF